MTGAVGIKQFRITRGVCFMAYRFFRSRGANAYHIAPPSPRLSFSCVHFAIATVLPSKDTFRGGDGSGGGGGRRDGDGGAVTMTETTAGGVISCLVFS